MVSFAMFGLLFAMPQYFQAVMGQDPLGSGIRLLPLIGGLVIGAALATRLQAARSRDEVATAATPSSPRLAVNLVVAIGFAFMAVGLFLGSTTRVSSGTWWAVFWFIICGFGLGFSLPATMNAALGALSPERAGTGSGLIMACRQVGATIGVALLGNVLNSEYRDRVDVAIYRPWLPRRYARAWHGDGGCTTLGDVALGHSVRSAFVTSLDVMLCVCAGIAVGAMALALVFLPRRHAAARVPVSPVVSAHGSRRR